MSNLSYHPFRIILPALLSLFLSSNAFADNSTPSSLPTREEAEKILQETFTISGYLGLNGEKDYAQEINVLRAALFGTFDAKAAYLFLQQEAKEKGLPAPDNTLFSIDGQKVAAEEVLSRDEAPDLFKNVLEQYNVLIRKHAVEVAAPYFTGHKITRHMAPPDDNFPTTLSEDGYFIAIEGLGDLADEPVLKDIQPTADGLLITGELATVLGDAPEIPPTFSLRLSPGDVPGSWKRQYTEYPAGTDETQGKK